MKPKKPKAKRSATKLTKQLANALYRTWKMLPGDLSLIYLECPDDEERAHDASMRALNAAVRSGWKTPK